MLNQPLVGRSGRAAVINNLFAWATSIDQKLLFSAVSKLDRFYDRDNILIDGSEQVQQTAMVALALSASEFNSVKTIGQNINWFLTQRF